MLDFPGEQDPKILVRERARGTKLEKLVNNLNDVLASELNEPIRTEMEKATKKRQRKQERTLAITKNTNGCL